MEGEFIGVISSEILEKNGLLFSLTFRHSLVWITIRLVGVNRHFIYSLIFCISITRQYQNLWLIRHHPPPIPRLLH